ncbi:phosphodiester glycosidase family protein [Spirulina sp. CS-785/01]|uniref:phosphodiester glycosidase family protein n=1 Tax=Spirulina sp. CS-785/01 TaxID=3021716 RepID=UPI00232E9DE8|nr:phosphodiester glycosidase family protein [Spirulina sp. CS-785/01]MDB9313371.1 phosphodiester glycosidase family protein [Spirulina sp. CS-785/01]
MSKKILQKIIWTTGILLVLLPVILYGGLAIQRPPRTPLEKQLFSGITYQRIPYDKPRPFLLHLITVDLKTPGLEFFVSPAVKAPNERWKFPAQTTTTFLEKYQLKLAINGSFFTPFYTKHPLDYYPKPGELVYVQGQSISGGIEYSPPGNGWTVLCVTPQQTVEIGGVSCPSDTVQGLAGGYQLIEGGNPARTFTEDEQDNLYPRTAVGVDGTGDTLYLVVIDGRQPWYSQGVSLAELTDILLELGSDRALVLDGGGSTTLAIEDNGQPKLLNSPIHTRIPLRQRPIANHLGLTVK